MTRRILEKLDIQIEQKYSVSGRDIPDYIMNNLNVLTKYLGLNVVAFILDQIKQELAFIDIAMENEEDPRWLNHMEEQIQGIKLTITSNW